MTHDGDFEVELVPVSAEKLKELNAAIWRGITSYPGPVTPVEVAAAALSVAAEIERCSGIQIVRQLDISSSKN